MLEFLDRLDALLAALSTLPAQDVDEWKTFRFAREYLRKRDFIATGMVKREN